MDKPYYPHLPIASIEILAKSLGTSKKLLMDLAEDIPNSYVNFTINTGTKDRDVHEPKYELKKLQKRINSRILEKIVFPQYLQGGIKDDISPRDYVRNSSFHAGSKSLICLDIRSFYDNIKEPYVFAIFKHLLKFPDDVSKLLTDVVLLNGRVPQGACTSSYIANLIFFNSEYRHVSRLRNKGITYTRLLDDITISSKTLLSKEDCTKIISDMAGLFKKYELKLHKGKTKTERSDDLNSKYTVTGVWIGHGIPKVRRADRNHIRHLVYICEKEHSKDNCHETYHALWNRVSGQVARLTRLKHAQAPSLRLRLSAILPHYDNTQKSKVIFEAQKLLRKSKSSHSNIGVITAYNKVMHSLGILSRTDSFTSKTLRKQLQNRYTGIPTKAQIWE